MLLVTKLKCNIFLKQEESGAPTEGEPGPDLPDLNSPAVPEQPPLEPQGVSWEETLPVRRRLEEYMSSLNKEGIAPRSDFINDLINKLKIPGTSRARLKAIDLVIEQNSIAQHNRPQTWARAAIILLQEVERWDAENPGN